MSLGRNHYLLKPRSCYVLSLSHDPIAERGSRRWRQLGAHREPRTRAIRYVECIIIVVHTQEYVVIIAVDDGGKLCIKGNFCLAVLQIPGAEVFEPAFGTLHAIKRSLQSVRERDSCRLCTSDCEITVDGDIAVDLNRPIETASETP